MTLKFNTHTHQVFGTSAHFVNVDNGMVADFIRSGGRYSIALYRNDDDAVQHKAIIRGYTKTRGGAFNAVVKLMRDHQNDA